jgi:hypothetical protein
MAEHRFAIPEGWRMESTGEIATLIGPEGDVRVDFMDLEPGGSIQETALAAWKHVDPDFASPVTREVAAPPQDGWDEIHQVLYATPAQEARAEVAIVRKLGGLSSI